MVVYCMENLYYILIIICFFPLLYLSWQDIKSQEISRNVTLATVFFALAFNSVALIFYNYQPAYYALLAALILGTVFLLCLILTKEKSLGMGDVYLFILMGLLVGLQNLIFSLSIMVLGALLYSIIKYKKIHLKQKVPLVPFISLGIFLTFVLTQLFLQS